jgi:hypothetical protein
MSSKRPQPTEKTESLAEAARRLDCDDGKGRFEKRLGKIVTAKPKDEPRKR